MFNQLFLKTIEYVKLLVFYKRIQLEAIKEVSSSSYWTTGGGATNISLI